MSEQYLMLEYLMKSNVHLDKVKDLTLLRGYHQIFEQNPGLHPDGFDDQNSGWPEELKSVCAEMWRRVDLDDSTINEEHMYYINKAFRQLMKASRTNG
jgi:hypothetical protein